MSGRKSKQKGNRTEREFARLIGGYRVPLSGAAEGYKGDVIGLGMTWECKARKDGFKQLYDWLEKADALAVKADRKPWLIILPAERFLGILGDYKKDFLDAVKKGDSAGDLEHMA